MVGLMEMLSNLSKHKASTTELLFATHPMSDERLQTAVASARSDYATAKNQPLHRERYMDHTAGLRKIKGAIEELQKGETLMAQEQFAEAQTYLQSALKQAPDDYAGLVMMAKCQLVLKKNDEAQRYTEKAKQVFPEEAQAYNLDGYVKIQKKQYEAALEDFNAYEKRLPGNPTTTFFMGFSYEGLEKRKEAAEHYYRFLKVVNEGKQAQYAYRRLVEWGYVK
jgi:beta-barrel assembly-enhancing protease